MVQPAHINSVDAFHFQSSLQKLNVYVDDKIRVLGCPVLSAGRGQGGELIVGIFAKQGTVDESVAAFE